MFGFVAVMHTLDGARRRTIAHGALHGAARSRAVLRGSCLHPHAAWYPAARGRPVRARGAAARVQHARKAKRAVQLRTGPIPSGAADRLSSPSGVGTHAYSTGVGGPGNRGTRGTLGSHRYSQVLTLLIVLTVLGGRCSSVCYGRPWLSSSASLRRRCTRRSSTFLFTTQVSTLLIEGPCCAS